MVESSRKQPDRPAAERRIIMTSFRLEQVDLQFRTRAGAPLAEKEGVIAWQDTLDGGFLVELSLPEAAYVEYLELEAEGCGQVFLLAEGRRCACLEPGQTRMDVNRVLTRAELLVNTDFADVRIRSVSLYSVQHTLLPEPFSYTRTAGTLSRAALTGVCGPAADYVEESAKLSVCENGNIRLSQDSALGEEEFTVSVTSEGITARCGSLRAAYYAADVICQLLADAQIPCCEIFDKPYKPFRASHLGLPSVEQMDFFKQYVRHVVMPGRFNVLILELSAFMEYESVPEINRAWARSCVAFREGRGPKPAHYGMHPSPDPLSHAQVRELLAYIRSMGIEPVPEIQSLGHVQYLTAAFPEISEHAELTFSNEDVNTNTDDLRPESKAAHCYCPSDPRSYELLFKVMDEVLEVFAPLRYVHMGHDEVYEIGLCPRCRETDPADLYDRDIRRIHDRLEGTGIRMMIWSDMVNPSSVRYRTIPALYKIPKDILLLDFTWYFHTESDIEVPLEQAGFDVSLANLYSSHFPRYAARRTAAFGGQTSTWLGNDEKTLSENGKFFDAMMVSQMLWSEQYDEARRTFYSLVIARRLSHIRAMLHGETGAFRPVWTPETIPADPEALRILGETGFTAGLIGSGEIALQTEASKLRFTHVTDRPELFEAWKETRNVGLYRIRFASGAETEVPVSYGYNIRVWDRAYAAPKPEQYYRHQGYIGTYAYAPAVRGVTAAGKPYCVGAFLWDNPRPDDPIVGITLLGAENTDARILLLGIEAC